ncbi:hypothetical protein [Mesorhizobium sp.]|nr:hypothetical protein [Mesorhizobium sp.]
MAFETSKEVAQHLPHFIEALGYLSPPQFEDQHIRQTGKTAA